MSEHKSENQIHDFLTFRKMITPIIIQIIFWVGVVVCIIYSLILITAGAGARYGGGTEVLAGLLMLLLGPLFVRVGCEILILLFRMDETLAEIKNNTERRG